MSRRTSSWVWVAVAVAVSVVAALEKLLVASDIDHGLPAAVGAVARVAFVPFWLSYTAGAWVALGVGQFWVVRDHTRGLGLAFAAAIGVHLALILWQTLRGAPPGVGVVLIFGPAALLTLLLCVVSVSALSERLPRAALAGFRTCATTYIAGVYLLDFTIPPQPASLHYWIFYGAFAGLDMLALAVRTLAWVRGLLWLWRSGAPAR